MHRVHEVPHFEKLHASDAYKSVVYLAGSWAVKEAIYKTLSNSEQEKFQFSRWYRKYGDRGQPIIGSDDHHNDNFMASISHDGGMLIASVLRVKRQ